MSERLTVYLNGRRAGNLDWDASLDVFAFSYLSDYLRSEDAVAISLYPADVEPESGEDSLRVLSEEEANYPNLTSRMAMQIGGAWEFKDVDISAFDAFARKCDINPKFVQGRIDRLAGELSSAMKSIDEELSDTGHPSTVYRTIASQSNERLNQLRG